MKLKDTCTEINSLKLRSDFNLSCFLHNRPNEVRQFFYKSLKSAIFDQILLQRNISENENHLHHPINQFRLIRRFRILWPKVQEIFDDEDIVSLL